MANAVLVAITISAILWFVWLVATDSFGAVVNFNEPPTTANGVLAATAFLFVAYTGYGRIATLGEEVKDPARIIPLAVVVTLAAAATLYMAIALGGRAWAGENWGAVLNLTRFIDSGFVRFGAITAMLGVLLNLVLGLSRVWLAMGRRGDMPVRLAVLDRRSEPIIAVVVTAILIAALTLLGDIGLAWSFSAMTVLLYYGITNLAALAVDRKRPTAWLGLASCAFLSFFVPPAIWVVGAGLTGVGILWKTGFRKFRSVPSRSL